MSRVEIRAERLKSALRSIPMFSGLKPPEMAPRGDADARVQRGAPLAGGDPADHLR